MDRYEIRRLALKELVDGIGRGGRTEVAKRIDKDPSYVSRLLYPPGKAGRKRIGDELLDALNKAYPTWLHGAPQPGHRAAPEPVRAATPGGDYIAFDLHARAPNSHPEGMPPVAQRLELAVWEVQRRLGYTPERGRIQLFTQFGSSMRGLLEEGDIAFIDTSVTEFAGDDCYLIAMGGDLQVKLLQRRGADLWVVSQNPDFPPWRCTEDVDLTICGKVVMRGGLRTV